MSFNSDKRILDKQQQQQQLSPSSVLPSNSYQQTPIMHIDNDISHLNILSNNNNNLINKISEPVRPYETTNNNNNLMNNQWKYETQQPQPQSHQSFQHLLQSNCNNNAILLNNQIEIQSREENGRNTMNQVATPTQHSIQQVQRFQQAQSINATAESGVRLFMFMLFFFDSIFSFLKFTFFFCGLLLLLAITCIYDVFHDKLQVIH